MAAMPTVYMVLVLVISMVLAVCVDILLVFLVQVYLPKRALLAAMRNAQASIELPGNFDEVAGQADEEEFELPELEDEEQENSLN